MNKPKVLQKGGRVIETRVSPRRGRFVVAEGRDLADAEHILLNILFAPFALRPRAPTRAVDVE